MSSRMGAAASLVSDRVQYSWELRELGLLRCEVESLRPPPGEVICCLARIMGESHDSGRVPGLDRIMDNRISSGGSRTFGGKSRDPLSFSRSGLIMGDFVIRSVPLKHPRVERCCAPFPTSFFHRKFSVTTIMVSLAIQGSVQSWM